MPRFSARVAAMSLVTLLVVGGTVLADLAVGPFRGVNPSTKSIMIGTNTGIQSYRLIGKTVIRTADGKTVPVKALAKVPQGVIAKVTHARGVALKVEFTKVAPQPGVPRKK